jgi:aryl-phospho-beta-D-glucosidase BglC (GH1 family)
MNRKFIIILILAVTVSLAAGVAVGILSQRRAVSGTDKPEKETIEFGNEASGESYETVDGTSGKESENQEDEDALKADGQSSGDKAEEAVDTENNDSGPDNDDGKGYYLDYASNNSWQDGKITMYGVDLRIRNESGMPVEGWELEIGIEGLDRVEGWNGSFKTNGEKLIVKNADYNGTISDGAAVDAGCNLGVKNGELKVSYAKLNGTECSVKSSLTDGNINKNANNNEKNKVNGSKDNDGDKEGREAAGEKELPERNDKAKQGDDWLHTDGNKILDAKGNEVWLTGVNWFGYNTGTNTFDGLWNSRLETTVRAVADRGFNLIRVPISAQLLNEWADGNYPKANYNNADNQELNAMNSLEIFDHFLKLAEDNGIKVLIDIHSAETDSMGHMANLWYTDKVSADEYLAALRWTAKRYKDNDTVIAFDLKNEPHGKPEEGSAAAIWNGSKADNNWRYMAERAALTVLNENPNVLVFVEGIEAYPIDVRSNSDYHSKSSGDYYFNWWGGNLRGVRDFPVELGKYDDKLVYSPHDYGPTVYKQPWFEGNYDYNSLMKDCWEENWFYIHKDNIAPLHIGEWGGFMQEPNLKWMTCLRQLIKKYRLSHTFWCLNANSGDTGGLLLDDFKTWDEEKYAFVKEVLWQSNGKFVGLDHEIPLGKNGISISDVK